MSRQPDFAAMGEGLLIREARPDDAAAACELVRSSIVELCGADHGGDRGRLAAWLANKTPDNLRAWIVGSHVFLAERDGVLAGVAAVTGEGVITLLYVLPAQRFTGVSKALLLALEERARDLGLDLCRLESTATALRFYEDCGYRLAEPDRHSRIMVKPL
ncbi:MAG TPA: GNAT family N-acetyltransferase [Lichenihabitans sp.]|jgi:GNAT superfamily N-acetyltransferase|nr:GNAT family N-acetyltransferase [Lichenihabitans sp.]